MTDSNDVKTLQDIYSHLIDVKASVSRLDNVPDTLKEIKDDLKEQRVQITDLHRVRDDHERRLRSLEEKKQQFNDDEVDEIKGVIHRHHSMRYIGGLAAAAAFTALASNFDRVAHFLAHIGG